MRKITSALSLALIALLCFAFKGDKMLPLGATAPMVDYEMLGVDDQGHTLASLKGEKGLLVIFSCNTCPFVLGWEDQFPKLGGMAKNLNIGMALVNSNTAKRDNEDSLEEMKKHYKEANYNCAYVLDEENQLADAFGAKTTPHVYLFDADMQLVYRGSVNNKYELKSKEATDFYLEKALKALANGEKVAPADTREMGCSIKRG